MINHIINHTVYVNEPAPVVGMGCTMIHYSDRDVYTIVEVCSASRFIMQEDDVIQDGNGYAKTITPNPEGAKVTVTKRNDGKWKVFHDTTRVLLGKRDFHYDLSF